MWIETHEGNFVQAAQILSVTVFAGPWPALMAQSGCGYACLARALDKTDAVELRGLLMHFLTNKCYEEMTILRFATWSRPSSVITEDE